MDIRIPGQSIKALSDDKTDKNTLKIKDLKHTDADNPNTAATKISDSPEIGKKDFNSVNSAIKAGNAEPELSLFSETGEYNSIDLSTENIKKQNTIRQMYSGIYPAHNNHQQNTEIFKNRVSGNYSQLAEVLTNNELTSTNINKSLMKYLAGDNVVKELEPVLNDEKMPREEKNVLINNKIREMQYAKIEPLVKTLQQNNLLDFAYMETLVNRIGLNQTAEVGKLLEAYLNNPELGRAGIGKPEAVKALIHDLAVPSALGHENNDNCASCAVQIRMAVMEPVQYTELALHLIEGESVKMKDGSLLSPGGSWDQEGDNRPVSSKALQSAFMNLLA